MFTSDFAQDFSGLSQRHIRALEKDNILKPMRQHGCKYYTFADIAILRIVWVLKQEGIKMDKIRLAYQFLSALDPEKPLTAYTFYHDGKDIFELTDDLTVILSKYGQLAMQGVIKTIPVGTELERTRKAVNRFVKTVLRNAADIQKGHATLYSPQDLDKLLA